MKKTEHELLKSYLAKARDKVRVARMLLEKGEWEDAVSRAYSVSKFLTPPNLST